MNNQEELNMEKKEWANVVKIAGREPAIYIQNMLDLFQRYDQIEIQVTDQYVERACNLIKQWECVGILPIEGYPISFVTTEEDIVLKSKQKMRGHINRIILTKLPELFRFTHN